MSNAEVTKVKQNYSIVGNSLKLEAAVNRALVVAPYNQSVLVIGESGVGKEFFPKIIHDNSPRKRRKYIAINCGAIPEGTIDSELFGHVKGAFTDATNDRKGYFEEANGGTIFLDEVAELPMTTQARLLRVLENGEFIKVGSSAVQKTDVRIVAATNVNLDAAIKEGRFREDLYYRLSTVRIDVPALRERGDDILMLAQNFVNNFLLTYNINEYIEFSEEAKRFILTYRWPGNVRQLKNVMDQVAMFHAGETVSAEAIRELVPDAAVTSQSLVSAGSIARNSTERDFMLKMIFGMRNEIDDLRAKLQQYEKVAGRPNFAKYDSEPDASRTIGKIVDMNQEPAVRKPSGNFYDYESGELLEKEENYVQDISLEEQKDEDDEVFAKGKSLEEIEKEAIRVSLHRNNNNRRKTALELQISERNLYRKINEYNLDDK